MLNRMYTVNRTQICNAVMSDASDPGLDLLLLQVKNTINRQTNATPTCSRRWCMSLSIFPESDCKQSNSFEAQCRSITTMKLEVIYFNYYP